MGTTGPPPSKPRFFYGWLIVLIAAAKGAFSVGSAQFATSVFLLPMQAELGWTRTMLFGALSARGLAAGLLQPLVGPLGDHRWAPRVVVPLGVVLLGLSFLMLRWVENPWVYYFWYAGVGALGLALTSNPVVDAVVLRWFIRKRAAALMWVNQGPGVAPMVFPLTITGLILLAGWRDAWLLFGLLTIALLFPLSLLLRTRPEDVGAQPDGEAPPARDARQQRQQQAALHERSYTRREALRTPAFWTITLAMALGTFGTPGFQAHWIPYLGEAGVGLGLAATGLTVYGIFGVLSRFVWAYLSDRYPVRLVFISQAALAAVAAISLLAVQNVVALFAWAVFTGITLVGFWQLQALLAVTYFGREHIGAIRGIMWPLSTISSAAAPLVLGALRDWQGTYTGAFLLVAAAWVMCSLLVLVTRPLQTAGQPKQPVGG